jgi:cyclopropane fatty-acyl-phospholipid synthase-like methyltransferase
MKKQTNLNQFYSENEISHWQQLLGKPMFYSFGDFSNTKEPLEAFKNNTRNFFPYITEGAKILDLGCGWGGPAQLLKAEKQVDYTGVTISQSQYHYCQKQLGLHVQLGNIETLNFDETYDVVFMMESLEHIQDIKALFTKLRPLAKTLLIQTNALHDRTERIGRTFGNSMVTYKGMEIAKALIDSGWYIMYEENKRFHSIPTFKFWSEGLKKLQSQDAALNPHFKALQSHIKAFETNPPAWCHTFPLLNLAAV